MRILLLCILLAPIAFADEMNPRPGDPDLCTPSWLNPTKQERTLDVPALIERLRNAPGKNTRILAARSLGRIGDRRAEDALIASLRSADKNLRTEAAWALGHFSSASEPMLLDAAKDASPHVRMSAACSLGKVGTDAATPALQQLAHDPDPLVAAAARLSLHLSVGDVAPAPVQSWAKGGKRLLPVPGRVNLIEFWATWCGPCLANVPHLTALQRAFAADGMVVVGATSVDAWGNTVEKVGSFIAKKSPGYAIAMLPVSGGIHRNPWFRQAHVEALPTAFLIGPDGRTAFIGDPLQIDEALVRRVAAGTYDYGAARKTFVADQEATALMARVEHSNDRATVLSLASQITAKGSAHVLTWLSSTLSNGQWKTDAGILSAALAASERAVALTRRQAPGALDELAHVCFMRGEVRKAVDAETEAVTKADGAMRDAQLANLRKYRAALR